MTPEQIAKMQAGREAAVKARREAQQQLEDDGQAQWLKRHQQAAIDHRRETSPEMSAYFDRCAKDKYHDYGD